jgi:GAF domain-containing protein
MADGTTPEYADLLRHRELEISREIADTAPSAGTAVEVYRLALGRVTPLVGADFASVFVRDAAETDLLRLVCAQNWPQSSAKYLDRIRIRVGRGPTGQAVDRAVPIEVADVFSDPGLEDWWEIARELGFVSLISLPLQGDDRVHGALTFYFTGERSFGEAERGLLQRVARQLARTAERANTVKAPRRASERLRLGNDELEQGFSDGDDDGEQASG